LRVVLGRHGFRLRLHSLFDCELQHKLQQLLRRSIISEEEFFASLSAEGLKFSKLGHRAQICCRGICKIGR
jgi:hypothetical protein